MSLRQESLGKEEELETPNLSSEPCGSTTNPARQSLASSRKQVLRGEERSSLRSVDSQSQGRAIEPRNRPCGSLRLGHNGGRAGGSRWPDPLGAAGVEERGQGTRGVPWNLRDPVVSILQSGSGTGSRTPWPPAARPDRWERTATHGRVSPSEGNRARRDGRPGSRSTSSYRRGGGTDHPGPRGGQRRSVLLDALPCGWL